ncbi:DUF6438 domain-containing protein [Sphingobium sp. AN641]|uniref:DUF6438 domain-containing protein n=1 Tax=Sphingobium sp. AN641 TaxID=3133443 RepID=UPI0030C1959F
MTSRPGTPGDTISIAAGPCFGVCPSYSVTVTPDGSGLLEPRKNTAVPGPTRFTVTAAQYRRLRAALAPFRPATGTAKRIGGKEHCTRFATDMPTYKIAWDQAGASRTQLDFQSGCQDARYARLRAALVATPRTLDIAPMLKARP